MLVALGSVLPSLSGLTGARILGAVVATAVAAAALAAAMNNLPASVILAGVLGRPGLSAYSVLAGLSVGALATPHGSVATMIAFARAGRPRGARTVLLISALTATPAAAAVLWLANG